MPVDGKKITIAILFGLGAALGLAAQFTPWATLDALDTDYGLWEAEAPGGSMGWYSEDVDGFEGVTMLRAAGPLMVVAILGAALATVLVLTRQKLAAAVIGASGALFSILAVVAYVLGIGAFYDDVIGIDSLFGWAAGFGISIASACLMLVGGVLGLTWYSRRIHRTADDVHLAQAELDHSLGGDDDWHDAPSTATGEAMPPWPGEELRSAHDHPSHHHGHMFAQDEPAVVVPQTRKLRCPECKNVFPSVLGESPVCPSCSYGA